MSIKQFPKDPQNQLLRENVAPPSWKNPVPNSGYHLVILGGGSAGLVAASVAAQLGAKVALIEKDALGGDCLNVGCVPSKAIIRAAKVIAELRSAERFGIDLHGETTVDFKRVMERVWEVRATISPYDSAERFTKLGVDIYFGTGQFTTEETINVNDQPLTFKRALIATGSRPLVPNIRGLAEVGYLTNETLWNLTTQPKRLAIIGAGPIGCEMAQAFQRLGTQVSLIDIAPQVLIREDPDAAELIQSRLSAEGVELHLATKTMSVSSQNGQKLLNLEQSGEIKSLFVDEILVAIGRIPNIEELNLEIAGVAFHPKGVTVNDYLQTTNKRIYAAGDVALPYQFTHAAGHSAALVVQNALFPTPKKSWRNLIMPWATYTDPEIAHVGLYAKDAVEKNIAIDTYRASISQNDRAVADGDDEGFIKVHTAKGSDKILGATIVARHAGDIISEITMAMQHKIGLGAISRVIHPYPTQAELITKVASEYSKTRLSPTNKMILGWLLPR